MRIALLVVFAMAIPCAAMAQRVRGISPTEDRLIEDLLARSNTARALAAELESTDVIVYIQFTGTVPPGRAATRLAAATAHYRYLRIVIGAMTHPRDRGALLAHELQHALEIGRSEVRDEPGIRRLYQRIGEDSSARFAFETTAARDVGQRVLRELTAPAAERTDGGRAR